MPSFAKHYDSPYCGQHGDVEMLDARPNYCPGGLLPIGNLALRFFAARHADCVGRSWYPPTARTQFTEHNNPPRRNVRPKAEATAKAISDQPTDQNLNPETPRQREAANRAADEKLRKQLIICRNC
jgi:hypothetical protein